MLRAPDGGTLLELSSFVRPEHQPGSPTAMANELGLRNVAFEVDDLQASVDDLAADGYGLVGAIGEYEKMWRMAYVRGPEGIIVLPKQRSNLTNGGIQLCTPGFTPFQGREIRLNQFRIGRIHVNAVA